VRARAKTCGVPNRSAKAMDVARKSRLIMSSPAAQRGAHLSPREPGEQCPTGSCTHATLTYG
jgi:hypothetical protein